jgi:hypothetical protein
MGVYVSSDGWEGLIFWPMVIFVIETVAAFSLSLSLSLSLSVLLEIKPRASYMVDKCSTTELHPHSFVLFCFAQAGLKHTILSGLSLLSAGITGMYHCDQLRVFFGSARVLTPGFMIVRQVLCTLNHVSSPSDVVVNSKV